MIFGDGESKMSLLNIKEGGPALHLMPNIQVGTGRYRRSHKYHDKNVDKVWVADNGYMVTVSAGSKFVKIWKVREEQAGPVFNSLRQTDRLNPKLLARFLILIDSHRHY